MGPTFSVPEEMRSLHIDVLKLSRHASNRLLAKGLKTLGQLHGKTVADIGALPGVGPKALDDIVAAVRRIGDAGAATSVPMSEEHERQLGESQAPPIAIPASVADWPVTVLAAPLQTFLQNRGITRIGDFHGLTEHDLLSISGLGPGKVNSLLAGLRELIAMPPEETFWRTADGTLATPRCPISFFHRVASAKSALAEVEALLSDLTKRNQEIFRLRWQRVEGVHNTLEDIAARYGLTRERVRQIVEKREALLSACGLKLPCLSSVTQILADAGGALPTSELMRRARDCGLVVEPEALWYLPDLGKLHLVPRVWYSRQIGLWLNEAGARQWLPEGKLSPTLRRTFAGILNDLRDVGCVSLAALRNTPFGASHAFGFVLRNRSLERVGDHFFLPTTHGSALTHIVSKMLAVAPSLELADVAAGLSRAKVVRRGRRVRLPVPPASALRNVLLRDGRFTVEGSTVSSLAPLPLDLLLSPTERVVVQAIEDAGGVASWSGIIDAGRRCRCADATITLALAQPFIVKRAAALYALRGRAVSESVLRARVAEQRLQRRETIVRCSVDGPRARVVYKLSAFSLAGVLPLPTRLRDLATRSWTGRFPNGVTSPIRVKSGFISRLRRWMQAENLKRDDLVLAEFDIANAVIQFEVVS